MRTRTLLLLAVACGLAILGAGVVQLLRVAGEDEPPPAAALGEPVRIGDLTITVEGYEHVQRTAVVTIVIGGVDDADGTSEFRLVVPGASLAPDGDAPAGVAPCAGTTTVEQRCALAFTLPDDSGSARVLLYRRGDEQVRWELGSPG